MYTIMRLSCFMSEDDSASEDDSMSQDDVLCIKLNLGLYNKRME